jgi:hypothetical protein
MAVVTQLFYTFELLPVRSYELVLTSCARKTSCGTDLMFASSLLILFSSRSLALAFLRSAMNWTSPRIFELFPVVPRPKKFTAVEALMSAIMFLSPGVCD